MDIQTINLDSLDSGPSLKLNTDEPKSSSTMLGVEMLMNEKKKPGDASSVSSPKSDINLGDLQSLEAELNDLSGSSKKTSAREAKSSLFSTPVSGIKLDINDKGSLNSGDSGDSLGSLGSAGSDTSKPVFKLNKDDGKKENTKTWDGYSKFNDIPVDPTKNIPTKPKLSQEDTLKEKFKYLRKLEALEQKGVTLSKKYTMESSLLEMQGEYETLVSEKERKNSVKFQGRMLMAAITGLEFLNNKFDPFDLHLDGWGEQVNENIDDYDEIFAELHEKYKSKATMAPELKLLFQLGGSAIMVHMTNTMFKSAMPGMDDIMRQNPELMQQFTQAAVNQMGEANPGLGGFMGNVMNSQMRPPAGMSAPPTMPTQGPGAPPPPRRQGSRPDLNFSRGPNDGINISQVGAPADPVMKSNRNGPPGGFNQSKSRPEMKGPSDVSGLLSGLKSKTVSTSSKDEGASSTISISDLKELSNQNMPKKSKRRQKSDKNTVSLDI